MLKRILSFILLVFVCGSFNHVFAQQTPPLPEPKTEAAANVAAQPEAKVESSAPETTTPRAKSAAALGNTRRASIIVCRPDTFGQQVFTLFTLDHICTRNGEFASIVVCGRMPIRPIDQPV